MNELIKNQSFSKKGSFLTLILFSVLTSFGQLPVGWEKLDIDPAINYTDISVTPNGTIYMVGTENTIYRSTDHGDTFQKLDPGMVTSERINSIYFLNDTVGFYVGNSMDLFKTTDGGENWYSVYSVTGTNQLYRLSFLNDMKGMAVGRYATILLTEDGGETWTKQIFSSISFKYTDAAYVSEDTLVAFGLLTASYDGGKTWSSPNEVLPQTKIQFINANQSIRLWSTGYMDVTYDGWKTFEQTIVVDEEIGTSRHMYFSDINTGYWLAGNMVYYSEDGFYTKTAIDLQTDMLLTKVRKFNDVLYVIGQGVLFAFKPEDLVTGYISDEELLVSEFISLNGGSDCLRIEGLNQYSSHNIKVFNGLGHQIYESSNYKNDWPNSHIKSGRYYYLLQVNGEHYQSGNVVVVGED
jgi:photosystem II stability/assembly factor-like uncharacterized protein